MNFEVFLKANCWIYSSFLLSKSDLTKRLTILKKKDEKPCCAMVSSMKNIYSSRVITTAEMIFVIQSRILCGMYCNILILMPKSAEFPLYFRNFALLKHFAQQRRTQCGPYHHAGNPFMRNYNSISHCGRLHMRLYYTY